MARAQRVAKTNLFRALRNRRGGASLKFQPRPIRKVIGNSRRCATFGAVRRKGDERKRTSGRKRLCRIRRERETSGPRRRHKILVFKSDGFTVTLGRPETRRGATKKDLSHLGIPSPRPRGIEGMRAIQCRMLPYADMRRGKMLEASRARTGVAKRRTFAPKGRSQ
ncbi:hypothetical protein MRX96_025833 [Rhipicephalus microplus]